MRMTVEFEPWNLQCNFADGKDMSDVMKVISEWNEYGVRISVSIVLGFLQWLIEQPDFDFDFMFLGFTTSMQEMGKVQDDWQAGDQNRRKWSRVFQLLGSIYEFEC